MLKVERKGLMLNERVGVLNQLESGKTLRKTALEFGVGKSTAIHKANVLEDYYNNISGEIKRCRRTTGNDEINRLCLLWFNDARGKRINNSGPLLQEQAKKFTNDLGNEMFKASNGWLDSFHSQNNIMFETMSRERGFLLFIFFN